MKSNAVERLLTQPEAADLCGVHISTLIEARRAGDLTALKFGRAVRYRPSDLARWQSLNAVGGDVR